MNWHEALARIESPDFDANVNAVSGMKAFFRAVDKESSVRGARRNMMESGEIREKALGRICDLAAAEFDSRYENPHDTPLAVLLWLTYYAAPEFADLAAHYTGSAPNCWYANKLAKTILMPSVVGSENTWVNFGGKDWNIPNSSATDSSVNMVDASVKYRFLPPAVIGVARLENRNYTVGQPS